MSSRAKRTAVVLSLIGAALLAAAIADAKPAADKAPTGRAAAAPPPAQSPQGVVNLNTATEEQLRLLPRIGPAKAQAIIKQRGRQKFRSTWDLVHVKGIGRKTYRKIRPFLTVQGETTLTTKAKLDRAAKE